MATTISVGDIVRFEVQSWEVLSCSVIDARSVPPTVQVRLVRHDLQRAATRFGAPTRYRSVRVERVVDARRCQLIARQEPLL